MPNFFVPFSDSPEQAERVYGAFLKNSTYPPVGTSRLFRITFQFRGKSLVAEVGKEIVGFPENVGPVLGITEARQLVCIHTQLRGGLSATPILASPESISARQYFDDFPAQT